MENNKAPLIFCPGTVGKDIADQISIKLGWEIVSRESNSAQWFSTELRQAFATGRPIIGVCAAGILIRILAPTISDKLSEPPVICVSPDGNFAIPLLGGHHGANLYAKQISKSLHAQLVLSTASDVLFGCALDEPPSGWRLHNHEDVKATVSAIIAGCNTSIIGYHNWLQPIFERPNVNQESSTKNEEEIVIKTENAPTLHYTKQTLTLGVGCIRNCSTQILYDLVVRSFKQAGLSLFAIEGIYSIDLKCNETAVQELAKLLGVPVRFYPPKNLDRITDCVPNPSAAVYQETGTHSVSEAAALMAAGTDGKIIIPKQIYRGATCAVACIGSNVRDKGKSRGLLMIVGIGPGGGEWFTAEALHMLGMAEDIVGYKKYIELLGVTVLNKQIFKFELGHETERCQFALERAATGRKVALVSSGDSGIYAMGSLVFELLSVQPEHSSLSDAARRVEVLSAPGISAMQMASARAGAVLGHDFCAISLSDLLTPREEILKRIKSAAEGDFVVAFYNPVSKRRRTLLKEARELLLDHRSSTAPVLIGKNLGRSQEELSILSLFELDSECVDMQSIVIVGNSNTQSFAVGDNKAGVAGKYIFTPRGYSNHIVKL